MSTDPAAVNDIGMARTALSSGIASIVLFVIYLLPGFGATLLYGSMLIGIVGVVCGAIALKRKQPKGMAVTGLILGAIAALTGIAAIIFALVFVGAFEF